MKIIFSIIIFSILTSCSNLSKSIVEEGTFEISNGIFADKKWKEDLSFQRYSWYQELTLQFDLMVTKIPAQSSFNFWFSQEELTALSSCRDARIILAYSLDTKIIPYSSLYIQLDKSGYSRIELPEFKRQLMQHPDSSMNSLRLYHVLGFCKKTENTNQLLINFPGYLEKKLK